MELIPVSFHFFFSVYTDLDLLYALSEGADIHMPKLAVSNSTAVLVPSCSGNVLGYYFFFPAKGLSKLDFYSTP